MLPVLFISLAIPINAMNGQVNMAHEEGGSEDGKTEPLSEVKKYHSYLLVIFYFNRKVHRSR